MTYSQPTVSTFSTPLSTATDQPEGSLILGGSGNDQLRGGIGADTLLGGLGNDLLAGGEGDDWLKGEAGDDFLYGNDGDDILDGGSSNDTVFTGEGSNIVQGGDGDDIIYLEGENVVMGGEGSDRYLMGDFEAAITSPDIFRDFQAGFGGDVIDIQSAIARVDPRYQTEYPWLYDPLHPFESGLIRLVASGDNTLLQVNLSFFSDTQGYATLALLQNVAPEQLTAFNFNPSHDPFGRPSSALGTDGNDSIAGSLDHDVISGLAGDDTIAGRDGDDRLDGGDGNDSIHGGDGSDTLLGGSGNDSIQGDSDFYGGDRYSPRPKPGGSDYIDGGDGNDSFYEWTGVSNTIIGGAGDDTFYYVSSQADWVGHEYWPVEGIDRLTGGEGRDTYKIRYSEHSPGDAVTDFAAGPAGDIIDVSELLNGFPGYAQGSNPFKTGHLVLEQSGTSTLLKVPGEFYPNGLRTILTLENTRIGDLTHDNFFPPYDPSGNSGSVIGTTGPDILDGTFYPELLQGLDGDDVVRGHRGDDRLEGGADNDRLEGGTGTDTLDGGTGDDRVSGGSGDDHLYAGEGNDRLQGDNGNDTLDGGPGDDLIMEVEGHHAVGSNDEMIWGGSGNDTIYAGAGNDYAEGGQGDDAIFGNSGDDFLFDVSGNNRIDGGTGNDTISMISYNDNDTSFDRITGGLGQDRYILYFDPSRPIGADHILDFETGAGGDIVDLSGITRFLSGYAEGADPFEAGLLRLTGSGSDTLLEAHLQGKAEFVPILLVADKTPQLFVSENFLWL